MSFLDNLENNLKALESLEQGGIDESKRRELERERALAAAPWAEKLKNGSYVPALMRDLTRAGFTRRTKVNFVWLGTTLRIEARGQRLDLEPTSGGVEAVFPDHRVPVDLEGSPDALVQQWTALLDAEAARSAFAATEIDE